MAESLLVEIVTPDGIRLSESVDELTAPSVDGQFGVLPGHRPMLATLATGIISLTRGRSVDQVAIGAGYVEIHDDKAVVLTDRYSTKDEIDPVRVRLDLKQADEALDHFEGELGSSEHAELVANELWAAALLELYGDPPPPTMRGFAETVTVEDFVHTAAEGDGDED